MIALFAGTGALPGLMLQPQARHRVGLVCQMAGFPTDLPPGTAAFTYRLESIGLLLDDLRGRGVTAIVMAGAVRRPELNVSFIDSRSEPLLDVLVPALGLGDDGTLRAVIALFEQEGFSVLGAQDLRPDLLPPPGIPTRAQPGMGSRDTVARGPDTVAMMGIMDSGQACVLRNGQVLATEGPDGTDAMLSNLTGAAGGMLYKAPKPMQDRRVDLPVIGPQTVTAAARAALSGIVIAQGGVMVIDLPEVIRRCDASGLFLWVRPE